MKDSIWNHNPAKFIKESKRLRTLCQRIIDGKETVIEGSRNMLKYRLWMKEEDNKDWDIFTVVVSDSDHLPVGAVRQYWAPEALQEKDKEIRKIEEFYRMAVLEAANRIRNEYEKHVELISAPDARSSRR